MPKVLVLYYSRQGSVKNLANEIASGIEKTACQAIIRTVAPLDSGHDEIPSEGPLYASLDDLKSCDGLVLGSPSYFGNMAAELKYFLDRSTPLWLSGAMIGKPAAVFTSSSSLHGGQESVLLSMLQPLLHHGMLVCGIPYSEKVIHTTLSGATPYGASHHASKDSTLLSDEEIFAAQALGQRIATISNQLAKDAA